ncbi:geranylgeranylglycerol-phosphate geranylgeranyltransferase [Methanomassiliicoccales archaeon LGM-DZ1]|nr:geranylgeranylglycerol-phosphate geranylgeranyltransferase [Methanomassiliicoccales archaeon LGM-DZ1]
MNKYLRLFRFGNGLMGALGTLIACFIAMGSDIADNAFDVAVACILVIIFVAGGNSLNDSIDWEIDKTAHPDRPIPKGEITPRTAHICGIGGLALSVAISFALNLGTVITVAVCAVLMYSYETLLKQRGFVGNLCIAVLTGLIFIFGGAVADDYSNVWILAILAFIVSVGREIAKDIEDEDSDAGSRRTLPMIIGNRKAAAVAAAFFIIGPVLSFVPFACDTFGIGYLFVIVPDAIFIYCAYSVFRDAHKTEKLAKIAMFAALIAFIVGVL